MPHRVTMREVAAVAGVSLATVSRVLNRHPHIDAATRRKVEAALKKTGYRVDPALRAIASCRWQDRRTKDGEVIAWLDFATPPTVPPPAARASAEREGYRLEHFRAAGITPAKRLGDILYHRGISGLVLANTAATPRLVDFPWERFAMVACWVGYAHSPVDCVRFNPFDTLRESLQRLHASGCHRPGLILVHDSGGLTVTNQKMLGAFQYYSRELFPRRTAPALVVHVNEARTPVVAPWFKEQRPDGLIGHHDGIYHQLLLAGFRFPRDAAYLSLMSDQTGGKIACFASMRDRCAEVAVEQVALRLRHNQRGIPAHPMNFVLDPIWVPGRTCPENRLPLP